MIVLAAMLLGQGVSAQAPLDNAAGDNYRIGPGDLIEVRVYEQEDLDTTLRVSAGGSIRLPLIGAVSVAGMSEHEAEEVLAARLEEGGFLRAPHVTVVIIENVSNMVAILGEVTSPGRYSLDFGNTVVDIIALANGVTERANDHVIVTSGDRRTQIDLDAVLRGEASGRESENGWRLRAGDVVYVPRMDVFYLYGEARQPGAYRLERNMNVMQALAVGGSLTERGSDRRILIHRIDQETGRSSEHSAGLSDRVMPNDVIYVRERIF